MQAACSDTPHRTINPFIPKYMPSRRAPVRFSSSSITSESMTSSSTSNPASPMPTATAVAMAPPSCLIQPNGNNAAA
ncbi:hypothetical protein D3C76_1758650 [compost metagenome]